jgi:hypothetical protein
MGCGTACTHKGGAGPQATRATARGVGNFFRVYFLDGLWRSPAQPSKALDSAPAQPLIHARTAVGGVQSKRGDHARTAACRTRPRPCDPHRPAARFPAARFPDRPTSPPPGGSLPRPADLAPARRLASPTPTHTVPPAARFPDLAPGRLPQSRR